MRRAVTLIVLGAFFAGVYFALKLLPWWAWIVGIVALFVAGKLFIGRILRSLLTIPFKAKGAVLRRATARVNAVNLLGSSGDPAQRSRFAIDVTIVPTNSGGNFSHWAPGELRLVSIDSKFDVESGDDDDACAIDTVEIEEDGQFKADEGMKYAGPQRLKITAGVAPGAKALKFRYYFEEFGEVPLEQTVANAA